MKNYAMLQLTEADPDVVQELSDKFTFKVPGAEFMPAVRKKRWDGKIRLFNKMNGEINAGLFYAIKNFAAQRGYGISLEETEYGLPNDKTKVNHMENMQWMETLGLPFKPRDYQYDAVAHAVENKRCVLISPTGSGKSFIAYLLTRWYLSRYDKPVLIVVPTTSLVEQLTQDYKDYGYDTDNLVHKIYAGKDKDTDRRIIITTWQSIHKLGRDWFTKFGMVIGDECHNFKAKSLSSIMNKATNAEYRFGMTGTLDGTQTNKMVLEGLFGKVHRVTYTKTLQEKGELAKLDIDIIMLKYKEAERERNKDATYQEEIDFLCLWNPRNVFVRNLSLSLSGNTLVLFNLVEKHGKPLRDMIEDKIDENRKFFFVSGETKTTDREAVRAIVEKQDNAIVLASLGTFSTGINIRNIHNIIFASPSKSQIRVLQSIGRGLRLSDDGRTTKLYDIADDLRYQRKANFTLRHSAQRVKIYNSENFDYKIHEVDL